MIAGEELGLVVPVGELSVLCGGIAERGESVQDAAEGWGEA